MQKLDVSEHTDQNFSFKNTTAVEAVFDFILLGFFFTCEENVYIQR